MGDGTKRLISRAYGLGFAAGRDYEALDTLEAMKALADFEDRQEKVVLELADEVEARIAAAVAREREACLAIAESVIDGELYQGARARDAIRARGSQKGEPS